MRLDLTSTSHGDCGRCTLLTARTAPLHMQKKRLQEAVEAGLRAVNLWAVRRKKVAQFSGGMKRRLSVAISFIGDPRVVYLDECSTVGLCSIAVTWVCLEECSCVGFTENTLSVAVSVLAPGNATPATPVIPCTALKLKRSSQADSALVLLGLQQSRDTGRVLHMQCRVLLT